MRDRLLIHKGIRQRKLQNLSRWQILISNSPNKNLQRVHFLPIRQRDVQNCDQVPQVSFSCLATFSEPRKRFYFSRNCRLRYRICPHVVGRMGQPVVRQPSTLPAASLARNMCGESPKWRTRNGMTGRSALHKTVKPWVKHNAIY